MNTEHSYFALEIPCIESFRIDVGTYRLYPLNFHCEHCKMKIWLCDDKTTDLTVVVVLYMCPLFPYSIVAILANIGVKL